jgi:hypothetical protein
MANADATSTYAIDLEDGTSGAAESAANALVNLKKRLDQDTAALGEMNKALRNLKGGSNVSLEQVKALTEQIKLQKDKIAAGQQSIISLGGSFNKVRPKPTRDGLAELAKTAQGMPGPLGGVLGKLASLREMIAGNVMRIALVGIAAGLIALTAAAVYATATLLKYAIAQAGARRSELLRLEGMTKMRNWWGLAAGNAKEMQGAIDRVTDSTNLGRDKAAEYTQQLYRMGLRGKNLEDALEGAAIKASAVGEEGAKSFMGWAAGANMAGQSVKRLTDDVKARFGGVVTAQMLDFDVQIERLHKNLGRLFADLSIEPFLKGLYSITQLFSQSTRSGQALRAVMTTLVQPLINAVTAAAPYVKRFFQGIVIGALLVSIALLSVRKWWRQTFGSSDMLKDLDLTKGALYAGVAAVGAFGLAMVATFGLITAALVAAAPFLWAAVTAVGALAVEGLILAAPFILGAVAIGALIAAGYQLYQLWKEIDWTGLGTSIVEGIVGGLKASAKWLIESVSELGTSALAALKDKLGIASPSKAFARLGVAIPQGIEAGVEQGSPAARNAVRGIVDAELGAGSGGAGGGVTVKVDVGGITVTTTGDKQAGDLVADLEPAIISLFERVAAQLGAAVP